MEVKSMDKKRSAFNENFETFLRDAPDFAQPWMQGIHSVEEASALDEKTLSLAYLAVLAAMRMPGGVPYYVRRAKEAGATREEVVSALLVGLPSAGIAVTQALPAALQAFDGD
jgi:alkylhydroperoxidase/carboxymuconolactone decarboxylase family protein YurZ